MGTGWFGGFRPGKLHRTKKKGQNFAVPPLFLCPLGDDSVQNAAMRRCGYNPGVMPAGTQAQAIGEHPRSSSPYRRLPARGEGEPDRIRENEVCEAGPSGGGGPAFFGL